MWGVKARPRQTGPRRYCAKVGSGAQLNGPRIRETRAVTTPMVPSESLTQAPEECSPEEMLLPQPLTRNRIGISRVGKILERESRLGVGPGHFLGGTCVCEVG